MNTRASLCQTLVQVACVMIVWTALSPPVWAEEVSEIRVEQLDALVNRVLRSSIWGEETGQWRSKTQLIFDGSAHQLVRKLFTVWDPMPSRNLDFTWTPAPGMATDEPIVAGDGHLVWRTRDRPAYDPHSRVIEYRGAMRQGRPDGFGEYRDLPGVWYEGNWSNGVAEGQGKLKLPNGDEYQGGFLGGRPHGRGRYIDSAGEIYLGPFVAGKREGLGTTVLPNGATYESEWRDGAEIESSRSIRVAQLRGQDGIGIPSGEEVRLNLKVNAVSPALFKGEMPGGDPEVAARALGYVGSNTDRGLVIRPNNKRLMGMWKGDTELQLTGKEESGRLDLPEPAYGVFSLGKTMLPPLDITLEVLNRATIPIQITGAYLDVSKSVSDLQPAIQISSGHRNQCGGTEGRLRPAYSPKLSIENFGWGPARNARIRFNFIEPNTNLVSRRDEMSRTLGEIVKSLTVDFERELQAAEVDTALLARQAKTKGFRCDVADVKACIPRIGGRRLFGTLSDRVGNPKGYSDQTAIATAVGGVLEYEWTDAGGRSHQRTSPFRGTLWLGQILVEAECGDGSTTERLGARPLQLQVDRTGYRIALPFQRGVPPGRVASYGLLIEAPRASEHDFTMVLQLADGREIRSRPINLLYFRPSWALGQRS